MRFPIPADMPLVDRLRMYEKTLDDRYERVGAELAKKRDNLDDRVRLKTERAQIAIALSDFKRLFDNELSQQ